MTNLADLEGRAGRAHSFMDGIAAPEPREGVLTASPAPTDGNTRLAIAIQHAMTTHASYFNQEVVLIFTKMRVK